MDILNSLAQLFGGTTKPAAPLIRPVSSDWEKGLSPQNLSKVFANPLNIPLDQSDVSFLKKGFIKVGPSKFMIPDPKIPLDKQLAPYKQGYADEQWLKKVSTINPATPYADVISKAATDHGVPAAVLGALLKHESAGFQPQYVTGYHTDGTGRGVAGIDKNAHPEVTDEQATDPKFAIPWAANYLSNLKKNQKGNIYNALREYNGGPNYTNSQPGYAGVPVAQRTKDYADNVYKQAEELAGGG